MSTRADPAAALGREGGGRRVVAALAITTTIGYGVLHYAYSVLLLPMARDLHASTTVVTGALTVSVLAGAAAAMPVGRWLDARGGRTLMTTGSVVATVLLAAWSRVDSVVGLYAVLAGIGLASAAVLYEPAFAVVVTWHQDPRRRASALLAVTVVAGFASTIFVPLTGYLVQAHGWRTTLVILAALYGAVTVPLHALAVRPPPAARAATGPVAAGRPPVRTAVRDRRFWLLAVAFVAQAAAVSVLSVHLVTYLVERGYPTGFAATVAGLFGVLSVTGRLATTAAGRRFAPAYVVGAVFASQAVAAALLPVIASSAAGVVCAVVGFGIGFGVATIARPTMLTGLYGTAGYATISGLLTVPITVAKAFAPLGAAAVRTSTGSYLLVFAAAALACAIAATGIAVTRMIKVPSIKDEGTCFDL
ncbi:MFS transporter [Actinomycetes bacterium KLBMP 9797]